MKNKEIECKASPTGLHEPDWNSVTITHSQGDVFIDVNCKHCGTSGCIGTNETLDKGIQW